jgi:hypothetical protein
MNLPKDMVPSDATIQLTQSEHERLLGHTNMLNVICAYVEDFCDSEMSTADGVKALHEAYLAERAKADRYGRLVLEMREHLDEPEQFKL